MKKTKKKDNALNLREKDPFLARERQRYEFPLPSREWIIEIIEKEGVPLGMPALAERLSIKEDEFVFFERRLKAMARDGQVLINRRGAVCAAQKLELVKCRVEAHKDGFGFAVPLDKQPKQADFVLYEREMRDLMHGDIITVRPAGIDRRGRREGQVLDIIERAQSEVVGRFYIERGVAIMEPEDKRLSQSVVLEPDSVAALKPQSGQVVAAKIESYPHNHQPAVARLLEVLGDYADSGMEIEIAVRKHRLPHEFSAACAKAAAKIPDKVRPSDRKGREDLRTLPLITIDGETARDFDDAVYAEKQGRNYRLVVAIADVSHYVRPGGDIDRDAYERATSVYFPRRVIPMLPENLSNGICSLNPDVERLCMVCDMTVTYAGNIKDYRFYPAVMRSHARLTYKQVWQNIEAGGDYPHKEQIETLYKLFQLLHKKRRQRGAMEFETIETQMLFDDNGKIERIIPVERNDAHKLIEECMLAANVCAADFLLKHKRHGLFRNHLGPTPEKLAALREQLGLLGLSLGGGDKPTPKDYAGLSEQIAGRSDRSLIQTMLLRSMQQAVYEAHNEGHFGLAYEHYVHFTSPIRRYPDLMVHRAIRAALEGGEYAPPSWNEAGVHTSACERRADEASRDVESWLKTYYMRDKVGEVFEGRITGMANFGLFVTLDGIHTEGMVHISDLGEDYFHYRPEVMRIEGERSGIRFEMGGQVTVRVARADLDTSKIDLTLVGGGEAKRGKNKAAAEPQRSSENNKKAGKGKTAAHSTENTPHRPSEKARAAAGKNGKSQTASPRGKANAKADTPQPESRLVPEGGLGEQKTAAAKPPRSSTKKAKTAPPPAAEAQRPSEKTSDAKARAGQTAAAVPPAAKTGRVLATVNGKITLVSGKAAVPPQTARPAADSPADGAKPAAEKRKNAAGKSRSGGKTAGGKKR
ncbi:Ribonuclease R [Kingella potus]|uniref:Ribonuclease R n=1 Tax=Kingella potus TaxID=265175 RepID=A0A377R154_9NEIS|nr:ribonuclease R [Kingella potus]STR00755.1 Ribonuclease R [Kingella potus]